MEWSIGKLPRVVFRVKKDLLEKIEKQGGLNSPYSKDILVSVEDFFEGNNVLGSFAANACTENLDVHEFYEILKNIKLKENVQDVWIVICDIDEEWPYSDTIYISANANEGIIYKWFGDGFPSEVWKIDCKENILTEIPEIENGFKVFGVWWD